MADLATSDAPAAPSNSSFPPHVAVDTAAAPAREFAETAVGAAPQSPTALEATAASVAVSHQPPAAEGDDGGNSSSEAEAEEPGEDMQVYCRCRYIWLQRHALPAGSCQNLIVTLCQQAKAGAASRPEINKSRILDKPSNCTSFYAGCIIQPAAAQDAGRKDHMPRARHAGAPP